MSTVPTKGKCVVDHEDGRRIGELLRIPSLAVVQHISGALARAGYDDLRPAHMPIFMYLDHPPHGTRVTELAERAQVTKQSMGELVAYLEERGYVERIADPTDRRAKLVRYTPLGWHVHEAAPRIALELEALWAERIGREKFNQLRSMLKELITALEVTSPRVPPEL
jgi:DNA-binding MarR family transcriptional regulator